MTNLLIKIAAAGLLFGALAGAAAAGEPAAATRTFCMQDGRCLVLTKGVPGEVRVINETQARAAGHAIQASEYADLLDRFEGGARFMSASDGHSLNALTWQTSIQNRMLVDLLKDMQDIKRLLGLTPQ